MSDSSCTSQTPVAMSRGVSRSHLARAADAAEVVTPVLWFGNHRPPGDSRPGGRGAGTERSAGEFPSLTEMKRELLEFTRGWPKRVGAELFVVGDDHRPLFLAKVRDLFAFISGYRQVRWSGGEEASLREDFFAFLQANVERFTTIEAFPHQPRRAGAYYMHADLPEPVPGLIDQFLSFFCPATEGDLILMRTALLTLFWGGEPGSRPAFLLTAEDDDDQGGRGVGKTMVADLFASLVGGSVDISPNDSIEKIKTRLLSAEGRAKRVGRIDNLKSRRWSSGGLEGLFTAAEISGHRLYQGEGSRPNLLTWFVTVNGASLSRDFAQRVVPIKLRRPEDTAGWDETIVGFLRENREAMVAEALERLASDAPPIAAAGRWASWEQEVLARSGGNASIQNLIAERRSAVDADGEERSIVEAYLREVLGRIFPQSPDDRLIFISWQQLAILLGEALGKSYSVEDARHLLQGLNIPEIGFGARTGAARGICWRGRLCPVDAKQEIIRADLLRASDRTLPSRSHPTMTHR